MIIFKSYFAKPVYSGILRMLILPYSYNSSENINTANSDIYNIDIYL
jgi:hypothetical protein